MAGRAWLLLSAGASDGNENRMHLLLCISSHGLGHLSQVSAVLEQLARLCCGFRLTIRSSLPISVWRQWIAADFDHWPAEDDIGMRMHSALDVDVLASEAAYRELHTYRDHKVQVLADALVERGVTHVLCDVPYLPLAAAQKVGLANAALCSLNWADIMQTYFDSGQSAVWVEQARDAYRNLDMFIKPELNMAMYWIDRVVDVGPIGRTGACRREAILGHISIMFSPELSESLCASDIYLVLVGMVGLEFSVDVSQWPVSCQGRVVVYLVPDGVSGFSGCLSSDTVTGCGSDGFSGSFGSSVSGSPSGLVGGSVSASVGASFADSGAESFDPSVVTTGYVSSGVCAAHLSASSATVSPVEKEEGVADAGQVDDVDRVLVDGHSTGQGVALAEFGAREFPLCIRPSALLENYQEIVASVDLMITKPGYGTFVKAAAVGIPLFYVERPDWPDVTGLVSWFETVGYCRAVSRRALSDGSIGADIEMMLSVGRSKPVVLNGHEAAAQKIADWLGITDR